MTLQKNITLLYYCCAYILNLYYYSVYIIIYNFLFFFEIIYNNISLDGYTVTIIYVVTCIFFFVAVTLNY